MISSIEIPYHEVQRRLAMDNPWWQAGQGIDQEERSWPRRGYFDQFSRLAADRSVKRAVVLIGPRRVGKTVMLKQFVQTLLDEGARGVDILYLSLDTPLYAGKSLESLLRLFMEVHRHAEGERLWVIFDEIQYLKNWEVHLKPLVDSYPQVRFVASGSAAAALKMKSRESGAGRFTEMILPPLTFAEFLAFIGAEEALVDETRMLCRDITALNRQFIDYLNFGGFPESVMNPAVRANPSRFLRQDVVDKVLLKDLPSLYGIADTQDLNRFFNMMAFNTGNELGLERLSKESDIGKQRLGEYLEYLEAAYLLRRVHRVDDTAARLRRARTFKVHLTNPSIRAALFGMVGSEDEALGRLAETALWSQWMHNAEISGSLHYARWKEGRKDMEVDLVSVDPGTQRPRFAAEIKWSDRIVDHPEELRALVDFSSRHRLVKPPIVTTRTISRNATLNGVEIQFLPTAFYCYLVAKSTVGRGDSPDAVSNT
jgi:predicted AAA+ superfamily ATPase